MSPAVYRVAEENKSTVHMSTTRVCTILTASITMQLFTHKQKTTNKTTTLKLNFDKNEVYIYIHLNIDTGSESLLRLGNNWTFQPTPVY